MALKFFKQRDIDEMDINNIPERFVNYFETLDDEGKRALVSSRPDIAKALGYDLGEEESEAEVQKPEEDDTAKKEYIVEDAIDEEIEQKEEAVEVTDDPEIEDDFTLIGNNLYAGQDLNAVIKDDMEPLEVLALPEKAKKCSLHHVLLKEKQIKYKRGGNTYSIVLHVCEQCNRIYLEESSMGYIHDNLTKRGVAHTFYDLGLTNRYLRSQMEAYEIGVEEKLYIPETWIEEDPTCPIHNESLYEIPCIRTYKDRKVEFTGHFCERCNKIMVRNAMASDLEDECSLKGVPMIEFEPIVKSAPRKKPVPKKEVKPNYIIENGKKEPYRYDHIADCYKLSEEDTVVISDSIYCILEGHHTEEVLALIWVNEKHGERAAYLFVVGYCSECQKYYMDVEDYNVVYHIGRPEVTLLSNIDDQDYQITSGEVFNLERDHLSDLEKDIDREISNIHGQPDYMSQYAVGAYDDGGLSYAKSVSQRKYGQRLEDLESYIPKPYSYRVDITLDGKTEVYYIGAADIELEDGVRVISANSELGYEMVNYQTVKVHKDGKEYDIKLSRQFDIDSAALYGYVNLRTDEDVIFKSGITDPFLVRVLNMRKRQHNLTDIFVTIQENQNRIVNEDFTKNLIVQGCAGSGKTMVLLHRLSALKYRQKSFDFSQNALILTPNDQFSLHIGDLADGLQIGSISRFSVEKYYSYMLQAYDNSFKPENDIVSEHLVRQDYVDYIYSNQFILDFNAAYEKVIDERNSLSETLDSLTDEMGLPRRNISFSDNTMVISQMKMAGDNMASMIRNKENEVVVAKSNLEGHVARRRFLEEKIPESKQFAATIVQEALPRVFTKIGAYISEKQHTIDGLQEQLNTLTEERDKVQNTIFMFGKRAKLEQLDTSIGDITKKLNSNKKQMEVEMEIFGVSQADKSDDEIISWMRQVVLYVKEVQDEIRLCNTTKEEYIRFSEELSGIDELIRPAIDRYNKALSEVYPENVKQKLEAFMSHVEEYTLINTYQMVFNEAVSLFKKENDIKNITGKYHRYDLYAELLFAIKYYGKVYGDSYFICIDEGQDLAVNEYHLIYELNKKNVTFNIFGDTNQLMKPGRGISDWDQLKSAFAARQFTLNENYRNTNQITRFCNSSFGMNVMQTGVDGAKVREIARKDLEKELYDLQITTERVAILVPRSVQKKKYIHTDLLPERITSLLGDRIDNGYIAVMYVDEVKGIEFDKVYVVGDKMNRNEKYIAYTRALSELILVVDASVTAYDDGSKKKAEPKKETKNELHKEGKKSSGTLKYRK